MNNTSHNEWSDAQYLAAAHVDQLSRDVRPEWWDPARVINIADRIDSDPEYSTALMSCLSMLRPELFAHAQSSSLVHTRDSYHVAGKELLSCEHACDPLDGHAARAFCYLRELVDAALHDDALRIVIDGLPYRLMHQYGMWFVVGLDAGDAQQLVHGNDLQVYLVKTIGVTGTLYRIDQALPRLAIEHIGALLWTLKEIPVADTRQADPEDYSNRRRRTESDKGGRS